MYTLNNDVFSEVIDITLYKYNSIDLKIWGLIKRHYSSKNISRDNILINADDLIVIINNHFIDELNIIDSIGEGSMQNEATSIYFIKRIYENMPNLKWIKITLNKNMSYNRLVEIDQIKTIKFNIKTLRGTFRLFDHFNRHQLSAINNLLYKIGIFKDNEYFKVVRVQDLLNKIDLFLTADNDIEVITLLSSITHYFEQYEIDNPEVLLITDIKSDI